MKTTKTIFLLFLLLCIGYTNTYAQVEGEPLPSEISNGSQVTYATFLSRLIVNLSKDAYTDKFVPIVSNWDPSKTTKAQTLDILKSIEFYIKSIHFKPEWKAAQLEWRSQVTKATENKDIVILIKELEANMQLSAFEKTWSADRAAWLLDVETFLKK